MPYTPSARHGERGSVLIYIFIGIILFAALTFAVSRSNREGTGTVDRERADLQATQILDYTGVLRRTVQTMKIAGINDNDLCFNHSGWGSPAYDHAGCSTPAHQVFLPSGGGLSFQRPDQNLLDRGFSTQTGWGSWYITGANRVAGVGGDCVNDGECNELLLVLPFIRAEVCAALNKRLQNGTGDTVPVDAGGFERASPYAGTYVTGQVIDTGTLDGKRSGCFTVTTPPVDGAHIFYAVLVAR